VVVDEAVHCQPPRKQDHMLRHGRHTAVLAALATSLLSVTATSASCGGETSSTPLQLGDPPSVSWPPTLSCPTSLAALCDTEDLALVGTVNLDRPSAITAITFGTRANVVCRWPLGESACEEIGPSGSVVDGEAGVYAVES
jgi:hypothetical protein